MITTSEIMLEVCILSAAPPRAWCQAKRSHHAQHCWLRVCSFNPWSPSVSSGTLTLPIRLACIHFCLASDTACTRMQELAEKGHAIGLNIPQLASLRDCLAALHWATRARALLASTEPDPSPAARAEPQKEPAGDANAQASAPAETSSAAAAGQLPGSSPAAVPAAEPLELQVVSMGQFLKNMLQAQCACALCKSSWQLDHVEDAFSS